MSVTFIQQKQTKKKIWRRFFFRKYWLKSSGIKKAPATPQLICWNFISKIRLIYPINWPIMDIEKFYEL